jgi:hypothetical protein
MRQKQMANILLKATITMLQMALLYVMNWLKELSLDIGKDAGRKGKHRPMASFL